MWSSLKNASKEDAGAVSLWPPELPWLLAAYAVACDAPSVLELLVLCTALALRLAALPLPPPLGGAEEEERVE